MLDYLVKADRGLLDPSEINKDIELDDLIQQRITDALSLATKHGYEEKELSAFLAGLAVLPPPVPIDEYAAAHGIELAAIESFASDLNPLLERTNYGLMFRDEPTETLIHKRYATSRDALERVASNLLARQDTSVYAARALPRLLHELDDGERLFALAFDDRIPASITSTVGKRNIQYARLKAATLHAALKVDYNNLVRLLVELSTIAEIDQRGANYLLEHPDLVVAAEDVDARRRLFEIRTAWPGTRHARLAIVNVLSGDATEATRPVYFAVVAHLPFAATLSNGDVDGIFMDVHTNKCATVCHDLPPWFWLCVGLLSKAPNITHVCKDGRSFIINGLAAVSENSSWPRMGHNSSSEAMMNFRGSHLPCLANARR